MKQFVSKMEKFASKFDRLLIRFVLLNGIYVLVSSMFNLESTDGIVWEYWYQLLIAMLWTIISYETKENK